MTPHDLRATVTVHTYHTFHVQAPHADAEAVSATLRAMLGGAGTIWAATSDGHVTRAEYYVGSRRTLPVPDEDDLTAFLATGQEHQRVTGVVQGALPEGYTITGSSEGDPLFGTMTVAERPIYPDGRLPFAEVIALARAEEAKARARAQYSLQGVTLSPWTVTDDYCAARTVLGADPDELSTRVAFIEKTPRVRFQALLPGENLIHDAPNWRSGPKGTSSHDPEGDQAYGFDPESRAWCDEQLRAMGATLT
ncbi:hypothetical protein [Deinococcus soli (ex Cha et al. 2016)]|uniref:Uncharacterized protein n=2 Tax=Deinococcus soli (ex Cha et al. 2016) TaxID=1309411 RepID=A0ACC6KH11_9DEIO|nr:hypothetical protein [Deinococcus soli (ex Cha et al. 2016)]MDR6218896.1 hypothetical protein [Deinococcus soli (ex Cha et al. 2016)]MDR6328693.1 hypothetical protein [Deinococcus soli (ex Cha et al. 2016)]MDR6751820.1 hypothetical protein [Deinococcus soli (ex Cha et al. 2016)]